MKIRTFIQENQLLGMDYHAVGIEVGHGFKSVRIGFYLVNLAVLARLARKKYGFKLLGALFSFAKYRESYNNCFLAENHTLARFLWLGMHVIRWTRCRS